VGGCTERRSVKNKAKTWVKGRNNEGEDEDEVEDRLRLSDMPQKTPTVPC
jgi:hypothetical protein